MKGGKTIDASNVATETQLTEIDDRIRKEVSLSDYGRHLAKKGFPSCYPSLAHIMWRVANGGRAGAQVQDNCVVLNDNMSSKMSELAEKIEDLNDSIGGTITDKVRREQQAML